MTNHIHKTESTTNILSLLIITFLALFSFSVNAKESNGFENNFKWGELKSLPVDGTLLQYSIGESNGAAIVVGGYYAISDTTINYSDNISILPHGADRWISNFKLPYSVASAAVASNKSSTYLIGGINNNEVINSVTKLTWSSDTRSIDIAKLPSLPLKLTNLTAATIDNTIYVVGSDTDGDQRFIFFDGRSWSVATKLPTNIEYPTLIAQNGADSRNLYLFGEKGGNFVSFEYRLSTKSWRELSSFGSFKALDKAISVGKSSILFHGNINNREQMVLYNTLLDSWNIIDDSTLEKRQNIKLSNLGKGWIVVDNRSQNTLSITYEAVENPATFGFINWVVLFLYLVGMLSMGWYFMRRSSSTDDFYKGGGRIPWWAAGISLFATSLSAITFMAIPAKAFATDLKYFPMGVTILVIAFPIVKYYLPFLIKLNVTTAYEYLEKRFGYIVRLMASSLFIIFMITRIALSLYLPSLALTIVTSIDINTCILMMGIITVIYCTMGGVEAVVWSDVVQGFVLVGGALFAAIFLIYKIPGGVESVIDISIDNSKLKMFDFNLSLSSATFWVILLGGLCNNIISYSSDQTLIQRYITTDSEKSAAKSIIMNGFIGLFASALFYSIGTLLFSYYKSFPDHMNYAMENTDSIFPHFIMAEIPVGLAGLIIAAIFAATMSTVSSNVNSLSTAFTVDIYRKFTKSTSDKRELNVARISGVAMGGLGIFLATMMSSWNILSLLDFFNLILGFLSSGVSALFLIGIFMPRVGTTAVILGFILGNATLVFVSQYTNISFLLYGFTGLVATIGFSLIFSLFISNKKSSVGYTWRTLLK